MNIGTKVIDIDNPALVGVFGGVHYRGGIEHASVKYPGQPMRYLPTYRVQALKPTGPKPVTDEEFAMIERSHGKDRAEVARLAKANGVTIRIAADALLECDEDCECEACGGDS